MGQGGGHGAARGRRAQTVENLTIARLAMVNTIGENGEWDKAGSTGPRVAAVFPSMPAVMVERGLIPARF